MNMSKKALLIRHKAKPGKREDVKRIWEMYARPYVEAADGQLVYVYGFDDKDPDVTDASGADEFIKQPWYGEYERETAALLAGPSEFRTITPQWIKGEPA
jgi:hypothetical protein